MIRGRSRFYFMTAFTLSNAKLIVQMMEAEYTSEASVNFYQTARRNIPEDSHLHTRSRENLKSHLHTPVSLFLQVFRLHFCMYEFLISNVWRKTNYEAVHYVIFLQYPDTFISVRSKYSYLHFVSISFHLYSSVQWKMKFLWRKNRDPI
jgi:hypothetical protein